MWCLVTCSEFFGVTVIPTSPHVLLFLLSPGAWVEARRDCEWKQGIERTLHVSGRRAERHRKARRRIQEKSPHLLSLRRRHHRGWYSGLVRDENVWMHYHYRVFLKNALHESEEKMHGKTKMTLQRDENLVHEYQEYRVYFCIEIIFESWFFRLI